MGLVEGANLLLALLLGRELLVLRSLLKADRFIRTPLPENVSDASASGSAPMFFILIPVLREAGALPDAIAHFSALARGEAVELVLVTTSREEKERHRHRDAADTIAAARRLAQSGSCIHLHYDDPRGLKADQLNFAADACGAMAAFRNLAPENVFLLIYDVDSRPPMDTLQRFRRAMDRHPESRVFHQSSRFELRSPDAGSVPTLATAVCDSGALRANRFVLAYEIPRLLRRSRNSGNSFFSAWEYAHVTGHGLCIRLPLLKELPFPQRTPIEDMHYSFLLGTRAEPLIPVTSLDCAEVPDSVSAQFRQLTRWFIGPGRFLRYLRDPACAKGPRAKLQAMSAAIISLQWMFCAFILPYMAVLFFAGDTLTRLLAGALIVIYGAELVITDRSLMQADGRGVRVRRLAAYPLALTMFGAAGLLGALRLLLGHSDESKTERG